MAWLRLLYSLLKPLSFPALLETFSERRNSSLKKPTLQCLPNELLLEIFSFLELKSYIVSHSVCKKWHRLLPSTDVDPIRGRLFDLLYRVLLTPSFEKAFEWTDKHLQPFDREEYIRCLLSQYPAIPDEFRMWILEWPARMAIECTWPGLPLVDCAKYNQITRRSGVNWISYRSFSPQLSALVYKRNTPSQISIPALLLWRVATQVDWLCFEQDDPDLFGRVFRNDAHDHPLGGMPYFPPRDDGESYNSDILIFEDWIDYLENLWTSTCHSLQYRNKVDSQRDPPIHFPALFQFDSNASDVLPAPSWISPMAP